MVSMLPLGLVRKRVVDSGVKPLGPVIIALSTVILALSKLAVYPTDALEAPLAVAVSVVIIFLLPFSTSLP